MTVIWGCTWHVGNHHGWVSSFDVVQSRLLLFHIYMKGFHTTSDLYFVDKFIIIHQTDQRKCRQSVFPQVYVAYELQQPKWRGDSGQPSSGPQVCPCELVHQHGAPGHQTGAVRQLRGGRRRNSGGHRERRRCFSARGTGQSWGVHPAVHGADRTSLQGGGGRGGARDRSMSQTPTKWPQSATVPTWRMTSRVHRTARMRRKETGWEKLTWIYLKRPIKPSFNQAVFSISNCTKLNCAALRRVDKTSMSIHLYWYFFNVFVVGLRN